MTKFFKLTVLSLVLLVPVSSHAMLSSAARRAMPSIGRVAMQARAASSSKEEVKSVKELTAEIDEAKSVLYKAKARFKLLDCVDSAAIAAGAITPYAVFASTYVASQSLTAASALTALSVVGGRPFMETLLDSSGTLHVPLAACTASIATPLAVMSYAYANSYSLSAASVVAALSVADTGLAYALSSSDTPRFALKAQYDSQDAERRLNRLASQKVRIVNH